MESLFFKLQKLNPSYTQWEYQQYVFWKDKAEYLDNMLLDLYRKQTRPDTEVEALKRLGKIEQLLAIKCVIIETDKIYSQLGE